MELGSVTLKRIGFFCFPIKHSTHTTPESGLRPRNSGLKGPHTYAQPFLTSNGTRPTSLGVTNSSRHRSSESGFPLLTPTMQAGQDSDGWVGGFQGMCTLHAGVMLYFIFAQESFSKMFLSVSARVIRLRLTLGISSSFYY